MDLIGKTVIVTGASQGIGAATARAFASAGAKVVLVARSEEPLGALSAEIGGSRSLVVPTDMSKPSQIKAMVQRASEFSGSIDILVNNAGVGLNSPVAEMSTENFCKVFEVNTLGPLLAMQEVIPLMKRSGGGIIINVSSMTTRLATPRSGGYRASKMALDALSDAARIELREDNIRVITAYPGLTSTGFFSHSLGNKAKTTPQSLNLPPGRSPQFVAQKIVKGAQREPREIYMGLRGSVGGKFAMLFPAIIEYIILLKLSRR